MNSKHVITVDHANFQTEVIQRSQRTPVLVDFWAPWCGPCRMLGPVLERLAAEYNGRFVLAKVNADHNPQLSMQYQVRGIPAVKAFYNGRVVDEFVGAQPEPVVRQFLQRLLAAAQPAPPEPQTAAGPEQRLAQARRLLERGQGCEAQALLAKFSEEPFAAQARALLPLARFLCQVARGEGLTGRTELDDLYRQAAEAMRRREPSAALYQLLAALHRETPAQQARTREVMNGLFALIGEDSPLVAQYRQQLNALA